MNEDEDIVDADDSKGKWRLEERGAPAVTVSKFLGWLELLPLAVDMGERLFTPSSWPIWRDGALDGSLQRLIGKQTHWSSLVRYPADGMAYVVGAIVHPGLDEPVPFTKGQRMRGPIYTLLLEAGDWRIHSVGLPVAPAVFGKTAYSW